MPSSSSSRHFYPSIFPTITCFRRQFLRQMWPIHLAFLFFSVCRILLPSLTQHKTLLISHTTGPIDPLHPSPALHFKTFQVFLIHFHKCQSSHHKWLHYKCSILLVSSSNLYLICWWKVFLCHGNPGFKFACTSCITSYHATQIVGILHTFPLSGLS